MSSSPDLDDGTTIRLTPDEAVVLFDLLSRWSDERGKGETPSHACFQSTAEGAVLNNLLADLERQLAVAFETDYDRTVEEARSRLAHQWDYPPLRAEYRSGRARSTT